MSALDGGPDGDLPDLDVVGLLKGEGEGTGDGPGLDRELVHPLADLVALGSVVEGVGEVRADIPG